MNFGISLFHVPEPISKSAELSRTLLLTATIALLLAFAPHSLKAPILKGCKIL